ncbi:MAG: hypothetical protein IJ740_13405 [Ruminococcus sp.]|nr:hypothetical protein [Ruminococcus sp.]
MRNLANLSNEEIFDLMIAVAEPYSAITSDEEVKEAMKNGIKDVMCVVRKKYMKEAVQICAVLDGVPEQNYKLGVFTFVRRFTELITSDFGLDEVFSSGSQTDGASSGGVTETTKG